MEQFTAHRLRFVAEAVTPVRLHEYPGSALRGALFTALIDQFCMNKPVLARGGCPACPLAQECPVSTLAATLDPEADRGEQLPRAFTVEPPVQVSPRLMPGMQFEFGMTLFAEALHLFPYVVMALAQFERNGIGQPILGSGQRGRARICAVYAEHPLTGERQTVLHEAKRMVAMPDLAVTHEQIVALEAPPPGARVRLQFLTSARLIDRKQPVTYPDFRVIFQRLMERLEALARTFSTTPLDGDLKYRLVGQAQHVRLVENDTRWVALEGYSTRQYQRTSLGGLVGSAVYEAEDWSAFWPWLKWGELTHVGKNAVKGEGLIKWQMNESH